MLLHPLDLAGNLWIAEFCYIPKICEGRASSKLVAKALDVA